MIQIWLDRVSRLVTLCSSPQGSENQPQKPLSLLHSPPRCLRCGPNCPPTQCCTLQVAEIRVEMELRDEILPRAQNIQSRLDRQTIETEEVQDGLAQVWGQGPGSPEAWVCSTESRSTSVWPSSPLPPQPCLSPPQPLPPPGCQLSLPDSLGMQ